MKMESTRWEYAGSALGLLGAALLALQIAGVSRWGWVAFLASNGALIRFALVHRHRGLLLMNLGYTATSLVGVARAFGTGG